MHSKENTDNPNILERLENVTHRLESMQNRSNTKRENEYREALVEAVSVLHETKKSFQSKQLKDLREYLESVLKQ